MYRINGWSPQKTNAGGGFYIKLSKEWYDLVAKSSLNQEKIDNLIKNMGPIWLENHGFNKSLVTTIRVSWGEYGPEHITVPGNGCGMDIDYHIMGYSGIPGLSPHNVDTVYQASLILTIFLWIAEYIEMQK